MMRSAIGTLTALASAAAMLTLTACGGGGGGSAVVAAPTLAPSSGPLIFPLAVGQTVPVSGAIGVVEETASFTAVNTQQSFLITEPGQTAPFTIAGCKIKAPANYIFQYTGLPNNAAVITLTATAPGTCVINITDASNNAASLLITVTTTTGSLT